MPKVVDLYRLGFVCVYDFSGFLHQHTRFRFGNQKPFRKLLGSGKRYLGSLQGNERKRREYQELLREVIRFMRDDVSAIFTDMHEIPERLKNSMEEANRDLDTMATIVRNIKSETSQLSTIVADNESFAGSIHEKTEATRDMINELDGFIGKNMETVKDINAIVSRFERR